MTEGGNVNPEENIYCSVAGCNKDHAGMITVWLQDAPTGMPYRSRVWVCPAHKKLLRVVLKPVELDWPKGAKVTGIAP